jgi:uncharacterized protein (TIGR03643 family)
LREKPLNYGRFFDLAPKHSALQTVYSGMLTEQDTDRIIEMAWEDRTPFEAIKAQFGMSEPEVIALMRKEMTRSSFERWRRRVTGRKTKHAHSRSQSIDRFHCKRQRTITHNKISKR